MRTTAAVPARMRAAGTAPRRTVRPASNSTASAASGASTKSGRTGSWAKVGATRNAKAGTKSSVAGSAGMMKPPPEITGEDAMADGHKRGD